jgi:hypothetical protein
MHLQYKVLNGKNELVSNQDKISYVVEIVGEVNGAFPSAMSCLQTNSIPVLV